MADWKRQLSRDVGVQCSIIEWNEAEQRPQLGGAAAPDSLASASTAQQQQADDDSVFGFRRHPTGGAHGGRPRYFGFSSSQELSLLATDGSGSTTFAGDDDDDVGAVGIDFDEDDDVINMADEDDEEDDDNNEERAFLRWYMSASNAFVNGATLNVSSPPTTSQSMAALGCVQLSGHGWVPSRVEKLRREFRKCRGSSGAARSSSCHSEPDSAAGPGGGGATVRCCSATAVRSAAAAKAADVAAWRRQFRRRKAITLSDLDVEQSQALLGRAGAGGRTSGGGSCMGRIMSHDSAGEPDVVPLSPSLSMSVDSVMLGSKLARSFSQRSAATQQRLIYID